MITKEIRYYVIRNRTTGKFLRGTPGYNNWSADPRLFASIGRLRGFITSVLTQNRKHRELGYNSLMQDVSQWLIDEMVLTNQSTKELHEVVTSKTLVDLLVA
jgi:hypothetical protein